MQKISLHEINTGIGRNTHILKQLKFNTHKLQSKCFYISNIEAFPLTKTKLLNIFKQTIFINNKF